MNVADEHTVYPVRWSLLADTLWSKRFWIWFVAYGQHSADRRVGGRP